MTFPVIGTQYFRLTIKSRTVAQIRLVGRLSMDEPTGYAQLPDGRLGFELNEKTHRLLRRFRTKLLSAAYNAQDDIAEVLVAPPIPWTVRVPLTRAQHLERQAEEPPPPEPPVEESHQPDHQTGSSRSGELH